VTVAGAAKKHGDEPPMRDDETDIGPVGAAHVPVMVVQVVGGLRPRPGAHLVDGTVGLGGHAAALLDAAPDTTLLGVDRDPESLRRAAERLRFAGPRVTLRQGSFADLSRHMAEAGSPRADAILLDLGVSSPQLDRPERGFSMRQDGPLDMRMDPSRELTAATIVNEWDVEDIARVLAEWGEEPRARAVARAVVRARPITTTAALAAVVGRVAVRPASGRDAATRTFQGLRIAVNDEMGALDAVLERGWDLLRPGGRMAVLAYHSLEDRRVKLAFRRWAARCLCPPDVPVCRCGWTPVVKALTSRPLRPAPAEVARNPRARSARLRVVERLAEPS
jgi:16S rRNA (cytosine1402-N4)-methyltransferase